MKCRRHPQDVGVGVCAFCLRERLIALIEAQAIGTESPISSRSSGTCSPPPVYPKSVSPYGPRSDDRWNNQMFYSTPQIRPILRNKNSRLSKVSSIFRSGSGQIKEETKLSNAQRASSSSWISSLISTKRKKQPRSVSMQVTGYAFGSCEKNYCVNDRGASPVSSRKGKMQQGDSPYSSGHSSDSQSGVLKQSFRPPRRPSGCQRGSTASSFIFCLSPLLRPSPNRIDAGFSGEIRSGNRRNFSMASSFAGNRSRKLVDFGRYS